MWRLVAGITVFLLASPLAARETKAEKEVAASQFRRFFAKAEGSAECGEGARKEREQKVAALRAESVPLLNRLSKLKREKLEKSLESFLQATEAGEPAACLTTLSQAKADWKDAFRLVASPSQTPEFEVGRQTYATHCAGCHGSQGKGDGPLASKGRPMVPPPTNFMAAPPRLMSPYRAFNVLITGMEGTLMGSYEELLTTHEMWSLAFYLAALPHQGPHQGGGALEEMDLEVLSYRSDAELEKMLPSQLSLEERAKVIAYLRTRVAFDAALARKKSAKR